MRIHLDSAAAEPLLPEAGEAMERAIREGSAGHTSSIHAEGRRARRFLGETREAAAEFCASDPEEVVLVSGGTEANVLALRGILTRGDRVVTTTTEHPSILLPLREMHARGEIDLVLAPPGEILDATDSSARLVSLGWANHETGHIAPVEEISDAITGTKTLLHLDAGSAPGRLRSDPVRRADLVTISSEKIGGPIGIGALVLRRPARIGKIRAIFPGTAQAGRRAGGVSPVLAAGFAAALRAACGREPAEDALRARAARFRAALAEEFSRAGALEHSLVSDAERGLPGLLLYVFPGRSGDELVARLDLEGICASSGAACASGTGRGSEVLRAMGFDESWARGSLRLSFGKSTTQEELDEAARIIGRVVREFSPVARALV